MSGDGMQDGARAVVRSRIAVFENISSGGHGDEAQAAAAAGSRARATSSSSASSFTARTPSLAPTEQGQQQQQESQQSFSSRPAIPSSQKPRTSTLSPQAPSSDRLASSAARSPPTSTSTSPPRPAQLQALPRSDTSTSKPPLPRKASKPAVVPAAGSNRFDVVAKPGDTANNDTTAATSNAISNIVRKPILPPRKVDSNASISSLDLSTPSLPPLPASERPSGYSGRTVRSDSPDSQPSGNSLTKLSQMSLPTQSGLMRTLATTDPLNNAPAAATRPSTSLAGSTESGPASTPSRSSSASSSFPKPPSRSSTVSSSNSGLSATPPALPPRPRGGTASSEASTSSQTNTSMQSGQLSHRASLRDNRNSGISSRGVPPNDTTSHNRALAGSRTGPGQSVHLPPPPPSAPTASHASNNYNGRQPPSQAVGQSSSIIAVPKRYVDLWDRLIGHLKSSQLDTSAQGDTRAESLCRKFRTAAEEDRLDASIVREVWRKSQLSDKVLGRIWFTCDTEKRGSLNRVSFIKGMGMIDEELLRRKRLREA